MHTLVCSAQWHAEPGVHSPVLMCPVTCHQITAGLKSLWPGVTLIQLFSQAADPKGLPAACVYCHVSVRTLSTSKLFWR